MEKRSSSMAGPSPIWRREIATGGRTHAPQRPVTSFWPWVTIPLDRPRKLLTLAGQSHFQLFVTAQIRHRRNSEICSEVECAASSCFALHPDASAHQVDQLRRNRESQPGAAEFAR